MELTDTPRARPKDDDVEPELRAFVGALVELLLADLRAPSAETKGADDREAA